MDKLEIEPATDQPKPSRPALLILALVLVLGLIVGAWQFWQYTNVRAKHDLRHLHETRQRVFDAQLWKASNSKNAPHSKSIRQEMLLSLLQKHKLVGMSKADVIDLLGPLESGWALDNNESGYLLNESEPGGQIWLKLHFENDVVDRAKVDNVDP